MFGAGSSSFSLQVRVLLSQYVANITKLYVHSFSFVVLPVVACSAYPLDVGQLFRGTAWATSSTAGNRRCLLQVRDHREVGRR